MFTNFKKSFLFISTIYFLIFLLFITGDKSIASGNAILDFSNFENLDSYYALDGQWYFFHEELLTYETIKTKLANNEGILVDLPNSFETHTGEKNTYGTYAAILKIPESYVENLLAIHIPYQYSAYNLFVNNQKIASNGFPGNDKYAHTAEMAPRIGYFTPKSREITLVFQVSSFEHIRGGFENSIFFGNADSVSRKFNSNLIFNLFINGSVFIIGIFLTLLALYQKKKTTYFIFGSFCMVISARALFTVPFYYTILFPNISWLWGTRLEYILTEASSGLFIAFIWALHQEVFSKKIMKVLVSIHIVTIIITLFTNPVFFQALFFKVFYITIPVSAYILYVIMKSILNHSNYAKVNLIGILIILIAFFNDFFIGQNFYQSENLMLIAVAIYVIIHVIMLSKDFADQAKSQERLNKKLIALNSSLDEKVIERTLQLEEANLHLQELASKDGLTQIYNRNTFDEYIEKIFNNIKNNSKEAALLLMDIDSFKPYNDYYGHVKGDKLLKDIVSIVQKNLSEDIFFARYGGEEFAIIFENTNLVESLKLADNIRQSLEDEQLEHINSTLGYTTISIGVAILSPNSSFSSAIEWVDAADNKLYESKTNGRNRVT